MNRLYRSKRIATLAACIGATAAFGALGGASSAVAATVTCPSSVYGSGSSFQNTAQLNVWIPGYATHTNCTAAPTITYTKTSSGLGLAEFGATCAAAGIDPSQDPTAGALTPPVIDTYVGTDDAPLGGQMGCAQVASQAKTLNLLTIPVAQAPVALLLSLPANFSITASSVVDLPNVDLDALYTASVPAGGTDSHNGGAAYPANTWGAFFALLAGNSGQSLTITDNGTGAGDGGEKPITLQVRSTPSGTTYAFKNYLNQVDPTAWTAYADDFDLWPAATTNTGNASGGNLATDTAKNPGSVGYANQADAASAGNGGFTAGSTATTFGGSASHQILWAQEQNNGLGTSSPTYSDPSNFALGSTAVGNCSISALTQTEVGAPYSATDSWNGVLASDPNSGADLGAGSYPDCALTYILTWKHYRAPKLFGSTPAAQNQANFAQDFLKYVTSVSGGAAAIQSNFYQAVPNGFVSKQNAATALIGF